MKIQQLDLDILNPRIPGAHDPADALNRIVSSQRGKLLRLAADIVDIGLSPGELPYVIAHDADPTLSVTLDGNRRLAALKLLDNPALDTEVPFLATAEGRPLLKRLRELRPSFDRTAIEPIACVLFASREDAEPWLRRRHAGEMEGVGLTGWSAFEAARSRDPNDPMVALGDFLQAEKLGADEDQVLQRQ